MMDDTMNILAYLILIIAVVICRVLLGRITNTSSPKWRFMEWCGVFVVYNIIIQQIALFLTYRMLPSNTGSKVCYGYMAMCIFSISVVALFVIIIYYMMRKRRKISGIERMKLKDL